MENLIGIDVSNNVLDVCLLIGNDPYYHQYKNKEDGFFDLLALYHNFKVSAIAFEATGNYGKKLEKYLFNNGVNPYILKPLAVYNYRKVLPVRGKTDKIDSFAIAHFMRNGNLTEYLSYPVRDLFKPILTSLTLFDKQIQQTKNLIHSVELYPESYDVLEDLRDTVQYLTITKERLEKNSSAMLYEICPEAKIVRDDIAGVGDKLMLYLIPFLYDNFDKFTLKQINSFFGMNPLSYQSGTSVYKKPRISKHGNPKILKLLYMCAVSSVRNNEILKEKYTRLKESGKPTKVALVSVMSHLLRAITIKLSKETNRSLKK